VSRRIPHLCIKFAILARRIPGVALTPHRRSGIPFVHVFRSMERRERTNVIGRSSSRVHYTLGRSPGDTRQKRENRISIFARLPVPRDVHAAAFRAGNFRAVRRCARVSFAATFTVFALRARRARRTLNTSRRSLDDRWTLGISVLRAWIMKRELKIFPLGLFNVMNLRMRARALRARACARYSRRA